MDLDEVRAAIDRLDAQLAHLLAARIRLAHQAATAKQAEDRKLRDREREAAVIEAYRRRLRQAGLDPDAGERVACELVRVCMDAQQEEPHPLASPGQPREGEAP